MKDSCRCGVCKHYKKRTDTVLTNGGFDYSEGWGYCCYERKVDRDGILYFPKVGEYKVCEFFHSVFEDATIEISPIIAKQIVTELMMFCENSKDLDTTNAKVLMTILKNKIEYLEMFNGE